MKFKEHFHTEELENITEEIVFEQLHLMVQAGEEKIPESEQDPRLSFNFSGIQNVTRAGTPIPLVYGEVFAGSVVISAQVDTEQVQA